MEKFGNKILFEESAASFICDAFGIKIDNPKDVVLVTKDRVVTKQDGILALIDAAGEEENGR